MGTERPNIYGNEEFKEFTEGLNDRKAFSFGKKNIYNQQAVKEGISKDPVQLPEWEENKPSVIVPIINYGSDGESMEDENKEIIKNNFQDNAIGEKLKPSAIYNAQHENITDETVLDKSVTDESRKKAVKDKEYKLPPLKILDSVKRESAASYRNEIRNKCAILEKTLADFHVRAAVSAVTRGPAVTRFELQPAPGVKVSSVTNLADDIALKLAAPSVRIEAPIPGKAAIGIEVPNSKNEQVLFREIVDCDDIRENSSKLYIGLGKDISGTIVPIDLTKMPHLLIAGSTGSGKSVCINTIIAGILYKANPNEVKFILVDPKVVELSNYDGIPYLMVPVVTDSKKAASALRWAVSEMERRYKFFADSHVREINSYNEQAKEKLPFIVIIIDELADLMAVAKADVEDAILRLAQKARAAGIHLILATQRPSVDVITGIVKANVPSRIAFAVSSQIDSRTILDMSGAEQLLGKGDMLFLPIGSNKPLRVQGAFVSDDELHRITEFIMRQEIPVNYTEEITEQALESDNKSNTSGEGGTIIDDELFEDALRLVFDLGQVSASMLQRRFRVGYTRAARLVDTMEELGIVGSAAGSKPREVIMSREEVEERFLNSY
ncbi:MAG: DNA translocase FtsK [Phascolarctobacterium sp.]|nr:DNA translocase FtsK [Phascolarctobacterium sp.]